ncbi:PqiA/YebS family transporter subunit [Vibrio cholerae]|nr:PqiA/YebS family transporter subunit [Vibrio cholerae]EGQ9322777.1 paraquat-inducible protein A [Vibrio cholerae]EGR0158600.1 paraquat-inducible protein A [Vibrio cholerae]EGR0518553.1 paraquat-inducible protein A [Vibrio cholerae]EGR1018814.1 paraquat-inducible protein A [Vibrio cholerae]
MATDRNGNHHLICCDECGLVSSLPKLSQGHIAHCPRCGHTLTQIQKHPYQTTIALAISSLILLMLSLSFPFMSFSVQGLTQEITLLNAAKMLEEFQNVLLAILLFSTVILLPALYLVIILFLYVKALRAKKALPSTSELWLTKYLCNLLFKVQPWLMADVFLIGVLVSLIKIASLADVSMGNSFWAFCCFSALMVKTVSSVDRFWLWQHFIPARIPQGVASGHTHCTHNHMNCHSCQQINPITSAKHPKCVRCGSRLHAYHPQLNLQWAWALLLAAIIFYIPANLYPMMYTVSLGKSEGSTIMQGVLVLWQLGSYPVAMVIFLASIFIPMAKMFALGWLYWQAGKLNVFPEQQNLKRLKLYRVTEFIGRWSMIDIFVVAILVALVQLHNLMAIYPGPAALSFAAVVILTMLSAMVFDSRILWQEPPVSHQQQ